MVELGGERRGATRPSPRRPSADEPLWVTRGELIFLAFCLACAVVSLLGRIGVVDLSGLAPLGLYPLYILGATAGWVSGNVFVSRRRRGLPRRWMLLVYFLGPLGPLTLLRSMAGADSQAMAPLVPVFAAGVYTVFFLVPLSLRSTLAVRRDLTLFGREIDSRDDDEPLTR